MREGYGGGDEMGKVAVEIIKDMLEELGYIQKRLGVLQDDIDYCISKTDDEIRKSLSYVYSELDEIRKSLGYIYSELDELKDL
jgi:hypothetical protein